MRTNEECKSYLNTFLRDHKFLSLATTDGKDVCNCNLHYSSNDNCDIYFASKTFKQHSKNLLSNSNTAIAIYDHDSLDSVVSGVQLKGVCKKCISKECLGEIEEYSKKFPGKQKEVEKIINNLDEVQFYKFSPKWARIINGNILAEPIEIVL